MAVTPLAEAVDALVRDGTTLAWEGAPVAAALALLRRRHLTVVTTHGGTAVDVLVGAGCVTRLVTSAVGAWPAIADPPPELELHSVLGMAAGYDAGASGVPFGLVRGYVGTDLTAYVPVRCPFSGEEVGAVRALAPDVAIVGGRVSRDGRVALDPRVRVAAYSARRTLVVAEGYTDAPDAPDAFPADLVAVASEVTDDWEALTRDRAEFATRVGQVRA